MAFAPSSQFGFAPQQQFVRPQQQYVQPQQQFWGGFPQYPQYPFPQQPSQRPVLTPKDDYVARLASHDNQLNGANQPYGPDGTIYYQTLMNPANGQAATFLNTPERQQWFKETMQRDYQMNGRIDGDALRDAIRKSYYATTGVDIPQIMSLPLPGPDLRQQTIFKATADPSKPGGLQQLSRDSGLSVRDLGIYSLWGHNASINKQITDQGTISFLKDALTNPQSRDYHLIKGSPEIGSYVNGLLQSRTPGMQNNIDFLGTLERVFHQRPGFLTQVHQQQQPGGWPPQQPTGWPPVQTGWGVQPGAWPPQQQPQFPQQWPSQPTQPRFWG